MNLIQFLRQYRIGEFAIFDLAIAFLGVWILSPWLSIGLEKIGLVIPRTNWLWLTIPIGVLTHVILKIETPLLTYLSDPNGHYIWKVAFIIMIFMGLRKIKTKTNE